MAFPKTYRTNAGWALSIGAIVALFSNLRNEQRAVISLAILGALGFLWSAWEHEWIRLNRKSVPRIAAILVSFFAIARFVWPPPRGRCDPSSLRNMPTDELKAAAKKLTDNLHDLHKQNSDEKYDLNNRLTNGGMSEMSEEFNKRIFEWQSASQRANSKYLEIFKTKYLKCICDIIRYESLWRTGDKISENTRYSITENMQRRRH